AGPFGFVGRAGVISDGSGLALARERSYDVVSGRFTMPDPLGLGGGDTNFYRYVGNVPTMYIDPVGTDYRLPDEYSHLDDLPRTGGGGGGGGAGDGGSLPPLPKPRGSGADDPPEEATSIPKGIGKLIRKEIENGQGDHGPNTPWKGEINPDDIP